MSLKCLMVAVSENMVLERSLSFMCWSVQQLISRARSGHGELAKLVPSARPICLLAFTILLEVRLLSTSEMLVAR